MALVRVHATFLLRCGLQQRAESSSINQVDVLEIHWRRGRRLCGVVVGSMAFNSWNFLSKIIESYGMGRDMGKARHHRR